VLDLDTFLPGVRGPKTVTRTGPTHTKLTVKTRSQRKQAIRVEDLRFWGFKGRGGSEKRTFSARVDCGKGRGAGGPVLGKKTGGKKEKRKSDANLEGWGKIGGKRFEKVLNFFLRGQRKSEGA